MQTKVWSAFLSRVSPYVAGVILIVFLINCLVGQSVSPTDWLLNMTVLGLAAVYAVMSALVFRTMR